MVLAREHKLHNQPQWDSTAVTLLIVDGFEFENTMTGFFTVLSASRHCIQVKLSNVNFILSFFVIRLYIDKIPFYKLMIDVGDIIKRKL